MKSVGEVMAIGRTFPESLQKALRSMESGLTGLDDYAFEGLGKGDDKNIIRGALSNPTPDRILKVAQALRYGFDAEQVHEFCHYDPWFIEQMQGIVDLESRVRAHGLPDDMPLADKVLLSDEVIEGTGPHPGRQRGLPTHLLRALTLKHVQDSLPHPLCPPLLQRRGGIIEFNRASPS